MILKISWPSKSTANVLTLHKEFISVGIDVVPKYLIGNPFNSSAHARGEKQFASSKENERRMLWKFQN